MNKVKEIFDKATLAIPGHSKMQTGGKEGKHSKYLTDILADLQTLQRTYPGCEW